MHFLLLRGSQEVLICVNMNIFGLGGSQEAIICANIEVNSGQELTYVLEWMIKCIYNLGSNKSFTCGIDFM